jgi:carnitine-CoA ligase
LVVTGPALLPALNAVAADLAATPPVVVYSVPVGAHDYVEHRDEVADPFTELPWSSLTAAAERPAVSVAFDDPANVISCVIRCSPRRRRRVPRGANE